MTKDPVCGKHVDENGAQATAIYKGALYAFCGQFCKASFNRDPEVYTEEREGVAQYNGENQRTF